VQCILVKKLFSRDDKETIRYYYLLHKENLSIDKKIWSRSKV